MSEARGYSRRRDDPAYLAEQQQFDQDMRARLRVLRLHLGLTQHEMAERLEVSVRAYRHRERQGTQSGTMFWCRVAMEFDVSLNWLARRRHVEFAPQRSPAD